MGTFFDNGDNALNAVTLFANGADYFLGGGGDGALPWGAGDERRGFDQVERLGRCWGGSGSNDGQDRGYFGFRSGW